MNVDSELHTPTATGKSSGHWLQHKRSGVWLTDESGREVISAFCSGGVFNFGFNAEDVRAEMLAIVSTHDAGLWAIPSERRNEGEQQFARLLPPPLSRTFFTSCAGEAFEVACKLAKRITGRGGLVSATQGYHGHIGFALAMDDDTMGPQEFAPLAGGVRRAVFGSIDSLAATMDETTAAVCLETIQAPAGINVAPVGYLAEVRRLCDERGALLLLDEVQAGLCRSGRIWAFEHHGIVPDLLVTGKGLTGGFYPLGALSYAERHHRYVVKPTSIHISSYAGNEIGASLAGALARRYADPALCQHVLAVGGMLALGLRDIAQRHPDVLHAEVRGQGLIYAVDARDKSLSSRLIAASLDAGLLVRGSRMHPPAVVFQPPLVISAAEVDEMLKRFEAGVLTLRTKN